MTALVAALFFVLGAALAGAVFVREVRRQARFLENRDPKGSERATARLPFGPARRLARAINTSLDEAKRESAGVQRRNDELMRSLSDLSHDIRTPLAAAKGHLQLIDGGGTAGSDAPASPDAPAAPAAPGHLDAAMARIDATTAILNQLLELTRANDPDREYRRDPVLLLPALVGVLADHEGEFARRGWEPLVSFAQEGVRVEADAQALERVLENLVTNAIRYGVPPFACTQSAAGDKVVLVLANGIAKGDMLDASALFDRFYRSDRSRTGAGTGLGLPIAQALAQGMGMQLSAEAHEGTLSLALTMRRARAPRLPHQKA